MPSKKDNSIARLTPSSINVTGSDGTVVRVATNSQENRIMNMLMACQLRDLFQQQIDKYKKGDVTMTPKEISDLAKAAKDLAQFSGEVYQGDSISDNKTEKAVEHADAVDVDFDKIEPAV